MFILFICLFWWGTGWLVFGLFVLLSVAAGCWLVVVCCAELPVSRCCLFVGSVARRWASPSSCFLFITAALYDWGTRGGPSFDAINYWIFFYTRTTCGGGEVVSQASGGTAFFVPTMLCWYMRKKNVKTVAIFIPVFRRCCCERHFVALIWAHWAAMRCCRRRC